MRQAVLFLPLILFYFTQPTITEWAILSHLRAGEQRRYMGK